MPRKRADLPDVYPIADLARIAFIPSSVDAITRAVGGRGIPQRGVVEMFGRESGGKTTVALTFLPDLYIDLERTLALDWAIKFAGKMQVSRPDTLEQAFGLVEHTLRSRPRLIALDSLGGGLSERELDSNQQAAQAGATSRWLRKLIPQLDNTCLLIVNQLRASFNPYGPSTTTPGGWVLHHLAGMRISVRRSDFIEIGDRKVGQSLLVRVEKSKVGVPWSEGELALDWEGACFYDNAEQLKEAVKARRVAQGKTA